jgi:predicted ester cyclase
MNLAVLPMLVLGAGSVVCAQPGETTPAARILAANEQLLNQGKVDTFDQFFSADYVNHSSSRPAGRESVRAYLEALRTAFPDLRVKVEILLQQGDTVAWRRLHKGTFTADLGSLKATGKPVEWSAVVISRVKDGRIVEEWGLGDLADQVRP